MSEIIDQTCAGIHDKLVDDVGALTANEAWNAFRDVVSRLDGSTYSHIVSHIVECGFDDYGLD